MAQIDVQKKRETVYKIELRKEDAKVSFKLTKDELSAFLWHLSMDIPSQLHTNGGSIISLEPSGSKLVMEIRNGDLVVSITLTKEEKEKLYQKLNSL